MLQGPGAGASVLAQRALGLMEERQVRAFELFEQGVLLVENCSRGSGVGDEPVSGARSDSKLGVNVLRAARRVDRWCKRTTCPIGRPEAVLFTAASARRWQECELSAFDRGTVGQS